MHETTGTFLFLNKAAEVSSLFTFLKEQLDIIVGFHDYSGALFDSLKSYKQVLCFHNRDKVETPPPSQWEKYVRPAKALEGDQLYYYAFGEGGFDVDLTQILSFETYMRRRSYN